MAKLVGPLMSFGASGKLADSLVFGSWKGIPTARQYVVPSNPQSAGQVAQRDLMTSIVNAWRRTDLSAAIRTAWDRLAAFKTVAASGFNLFTSNLVRLAAEDPDASAAVAVSSSVVDNINITMQNIDDGATADEAGDFQIVYGNSPSNMVYAANAAIFAGYLTLDASGEFSAPDVVYLSIRKAGTGATVYERSGIIEVATVAP